MTSSRRAGRLTWIGVLLLVAGLACLGWVGYQVFGTNITSERAFQRETTQLQQSWHRPASGSSSTPNSSQTSHSDGSHDRVVPGEAIALLRIPRFGAAFQVPILEGTDSEVLARGVGHYAGTALPGQVGNFAIAGHRITHGQPFAKLLQLRTGDPVVVETRTAVYTYVLDTSPAALTVDSSASWVLQPVPGKADAKPTRRTITLTTCSDLFHSPNRSVGFGHLVRTQSK